jgi:cytochrome c556
MRKPLLAAIVPLFALTACGNPDTPGGRAADARHESFEALGDAFKSLGDELKGQAPDAQKARAAAATVAAKAKELPSWFPAGSGPVDGLKTDAKAEVWTKAAEFTAEATKFQGTADKLLASADAFAGGQPVAALQEAVKEAGGSCKSCHEKFKTD